MSNSTNRFVLLLGSLCVAMLILGCTGSWRWFGVATWPFFYLCAAIGFGGGSAHKALWPSLLAILAAGLGLLVAIFVTEETGGPPRLVLGAPIATSFLVYGIWPLGVLIGVLYFRVFDRHVLPRHKLDAFLSEFRRRDSSN